MKSVFTTWVSFKLLLVFEIWKDGLWIPELGKASIKQIIESEVRRFMAG